MKINVDIKTGKDLNKKQATTYEEKIKAQIELYNCHIKATENLLKSHKNALDLANSSLKERIGRSGVGGRGKS